MGDVRRLAADLPGQRLDRFLAEREKDLSRSRIAGLVERGLVLVDGREVKASYRLKGDESIEVTVPAPEPIAALPEDIPIQVVYEDEDILVVDKPAGLVVHPAPGHSRGTLVNALLARLPHLEGVGDKLRPGIVHRLDKDTSGLMVVAKNSRAHASISCQIKERAIRKGYIALVKGDVRPPEGIIQGNVGRDPRNRKRMAVIPAGREAITEYRVMKRLPGCTLVEVFPRTGRTHQIRVHFSFLGHPLVGDPLYGGKDPRLARQFLHAHILGLRLPRREEYREFRSPLPSDLEEFLEGFERHENQRELAATR